MRFSALQRGASLRAQRASVDRCPRPAPSEREIDRPSASPFKGSASMRRYLPLIALLLAMPRAGSAAQTSEARVFLGYENQRADLFPSTLSAFDGLAISVERLVPPSVGSLLLDFRGGSRSTTFAGECEALPTPPCVPPTVHASSVQFLLLSGLRASLGPDRLRVFADGLGGIGYEGTSSSGSLFPGGNNDGWSPAVEVGVGADAGIRRHLDARVRCRGCPPISTTTSGTAGAIIMGLSTGLVLKP